MRRKTGKDLWKQKRVQVTVASSLGMALIVTGCGGNVATSASGGSGSNGTSKVTTITFWDENAGPTRTPYYQKLISEFEKQNPTIHVDYVGLPESSAQQKYDTAIAANAAPDVGDVPAQWLSDFLSKGALLPLDSYFNSWTYKNQMLPSVINGVRDLAPNHKLYQLSNTTMIDGIWYNNSWFTQAGLSAPTSWNQIFADAQKLTDTAKNHYGFSIRGGSGSLVELLSMMYSYSGITHFFVNGQSTINDPKNVAFVKRFVAMYGKYTPTSDVNQGYKQMVATLDNQVAAMIEHNIGNGPQTLAALGPSGTGFVPLPASGPDGTGPLVMVGGAFNGYGIFKSTKHPNASWKFLSYLVSAPSQSYWNENIGQLPTNTAVMKDAWVQKQPWVEAAFQALNNKNAVIINPPQYLPTYGSMMTNPLEPEFQKVLLGQMTAQQFLDNWAALLTKAKAQYDQQLKK